MQNITSEIKINKNIEECFSLFNFQEENMKLLDPSIIFHVPINETEDIIGSTYKQARDDNGDLFEIELQINEYVNKESYKYILVEFEIENQINVKYSYELTKLDEVNTKLVYNIVTTEKSLLTKLLLKYSQKKKDKEMQKHLEYIKSIIEKEKNSK